MKKYFAKWLPVEGEIKKGDKYIIGKSLGLGAYTEGYTGTAAIDFTENAQRDQEAKRLKLFLCSRDIQIGDDIWDERYKRFDKAVPGYNGLTSYKSWSEAMQPHAPMSSQKDLCKVIGEISPKATWVKEGDEFDEEDWRVFNTKYEMILVRDVVKIPDHAGYQPWIIQLKCPHCGTFT